MKSACDTASRPFVSLIAALSLSAACGLAGPVPASAQQSGRITESMVGTWILTPWEQRGAGRPEDAAVLVLRRDRTVTLRGGDAFMSGPDANSAHGKRPEFVVGHYSIDSSRKPAWIDFSFPDGKVLGLFENVELDRVRLELFVLAGSGPLGGHPTRFSDPNQDPSDAFGSIAFMLERATNAAVDAGGKLRRAARGQSRAEKEPAAEEAPKPRNGPTISDEALWDLYYYGAAGVKDCCAGDPDGCWRMSEARGRLADWCARGNRLACKLADMIQAESISCR